MLSVDTWRFARHPLKVNRTLRSEWVKNCSILIATACLFINGQFFWTFDVSEHDNRILHGRPVLRAYECSYANSLLSTTYTSLVWPLIDIGLGNVLPILTCLIFGGWGMHLIKQRRRRCGGKRKCSAFRVEPARKIDADLPKFNSCKTSHVRS